MHRNRSMCAPRLCMWLRRDPSRGTRITWRISHDDICASGAFTCSHGQTPSRCKSLLGHAIAAGLQVRSLSQLDSPQLFRLHISGSTMFVSALFVQAVFVATVFALLSSGERRIARIARRASRLRLSQPIITNETHPEYSSNWAGAVSNADAVRPPFMCPCCVPKDFCVGHVQERYRDVYCPDAKGTLGVF